METAIITIWWIGLAGALVMTLVVVKLVLLVVRTEKEILKLALRTLPAAQGIDRNTSLISGLVTTRKVAGGILGTVNAIAAGSSSIDEKLRGVGRALAERRP